MTYKNLHDLIFSSSSSMRYFLSQPVEMQLQLHSQNEYIHSAAELHLQVELLGKWNRAVEISESFDHYFLWQESDIVQWAQLQPQEDLPFFLSFTNETIIEVTIKANTRHIINVAKFILKTPFTKMLFDICLFVVYFNVSS